MNNAVDTSSSSPAKRRLLSVPCEVIYTFTTDGSINIRMSATVPAQMAPLGRFGLKLAIPCDYDRVSWFGLGPHEAYPDRKASVYLGQFHQSVDELHTPYVFPQECGRRADPR